MMNTEHKIITIAEAKKMAVDRIRRNTIYDVKDDSIPLLQDNYLETDYCWMFFRNKAIVIAPERALNGGAYCISKKGHVRYIADLSDDPVQLQEYLQTMSNYFKEQGL